MRAAFLYYPFEGLRALRKARGQAWNAACDKAMLANAEEPPFSRYGITKIEHLAIRLGGSAHHWMP